MTLCVKKGLKSHAHEARGECRSTEFTTAVSGFHGCMTLRLFRLGVTRRIYRDSETLLEQPGRKAITQILGGSDLQILEKIIFSSISLIIVEIERNIRSNYWALSRRGF